MTLNSAPKTRKFRPIEIIRSNTLRPGGRRLSARLLRKTREVIVRNQTWFIIPITCSCTAIGNPCATFVSMGAGVIKYEQLVMETVMERNVCIRACNMYARQYYTELIKKKKKSLSRVLYILYRPQCIYLPEWCMVVRRLLIYFSCLFMSVVFLVGNYRCRWWSVLAGLREKIVPRGH